MQANNICHQLYTTVTLPTFPILPQSQSQPSFPPQISSAPPKVPGGLGIGCLFGGKIKKKPLHPIHSRGGLIIGFSSAHRFSANNPFQHEWRATSRTGVDVVNAVLLQVRPSALFYEPTIICKCLFIKVLDNSWTAALYGWRWRLFLLPCPFKSLSNTS